MRVDELLRKHRVEFTESGQDYVVSCLNPDHDDSNPSLRIDKTIGVFHCLSCGFKGSIFHHFGEKVDALQMKRERLKKQINLKRAESIGLQMPPDAVPYRGTWRNILSSTYEDFNAFEHHSTEYVGRIV